MAGRKPVMLSRGAALEVLRTRGLQINNADGTSIAQVPPVDMPAVGTAEEVGPVDVLFVTVKTQQLEACVPLIAGVVRASPAAIVVPFLNGVEAADVIRAGLAKEGLPTATVIGGIAKCLTYVTEPGTCVFSFEISVLFGPTHDDFPAQLRPVLEGTAKALADSGVASTVAESPEHMTTELWKKFLVTGCIGPVTSACRAPVDVVMKVPQTRRMTIASMQEMAAVGRKAGVAIPDSAVEEAVAIGDRSPPNSTYSTTRDILSGRTSELLEFCGTVERIGREVGVPTPVHSQLLATLLPRELLARKELDFSLSGL